MKTILKLLLVAAVLNACVRGASAAWTYYQFKDTTEQTLLFGGDAAVDTLKEQIMRRAAELEVPIDPQQLEVTRDGPRTAARASYTQPVEIFPGFQYPFTFEFNVALALGTKSPTELREGARVQGTSVPEQRFEVAERGARLARRASWA